MNYIRYLALTGLGTLQLYATTEVATMYDIHPVIGFAVGVTLATATFVAVAEYTVGGIIYRPDSVNEQQFKLNGIVQCLTMPMIEPYLWLPGYWDINYFMVLGGSLVGWGMLFHVAKSV